MHRGVVRCGGVVWFDGGCGGVWCDVVWFDELVGCRYVCIGM